MVASAENSSVNAWNCNTNNANVNYNNGKWNSNYVRPSVAYYLEEMYFLFKFNFNVCNMRLLSGMLYFNVPHFF